jgi:peptide/nickel transport system substrate-binding protein
MRIAVLGLLEVEEDGRLLELGSGRQRALLARLLVQVGEPISAERLIDDLWAGRPPATAAKLLQGYVSQLRRVLPPDTIVTRGSGYLLVAETDAGEFERMLREAGGQEANKRAETLRSALMLWRGPAYADVEYEAWAQTEIGRLDELRLVALEERIDADLRLGEASQLVPELETLTSEHPLRERFRAQLMLALYRSGRQAEALQLFADTRRMLVEQLGVEPGPDLRDLQRKILEHDPELGAPPRPLARVGRRAPWIVLFCGLVLAGAAGAAGWELVRGHSETVVLIKPTISAGSIAIGGGVGWATNASTDSVSQIDLRTNTRAGTVPVGDTPAGIAAGGGFVWVANSLGGTVTKIDPRLNGGGGGVAETIRVGNGPSGLTVGGGRVWVANSLDRTVTEIVPSSPSASRTIAAPAGADAIVYGFGSIWVVSGTANAVTRIDARSGAVVSQIGVGNFPIAIAAGAGAVWVANSLDGTVSRIDPHTGTVVQLVPVGGSPSSIAVGSRAVWVGDARHATLTRIDPKLDKAVETLRTADPPQGLAVSRGKLYVTVGPPSSAHRGGTLNVLEYPTDSIDAAVAYDQQGSWSILSMTNDGLVTYQRIGGTNGIRVVPDLATSLPAISDAGRTYTFQVRTGIHYSNGALVQPADFRRAIERALHDQSLGPGFYFDEIVGAADCVATHKQCDLRKGIVTDPSAMTVTFHLTHPDPDFLDKLALPAADAVPASTPLKARLPLPATGPYMIASFNPTRGATLIRNPRFHEWSAAAQPLGYPAKIVYTFNKTERASLNAVEHGVADITFFEDPRVLGELRRAGYGGQTHSNPELATYYFFLNTTMPPFNRVQARRALNDAVDRTRLARLYAAGTGLTAQPTCQILPPNSIGYVRSCLYPHDLAKARRLVAASGTAGHAVTVSAGPPGFTSSAYLVSVLNSLGYKARLHAYKSVGAYHSARDRGQIAVGPTGWGADYPAPSAFFTQPLTCETARDPSLNLAAFCDPTIDREIERASASAIATDDPQAAPVAWSRIDHDVMQEAPWVPIANGTETDLISRRTGNYQFNPFFGVLFDQLWVR